MLRRNAGARRSGGSCRVEENVAVSGGPYLRKLGFQKFGGCR
jgi:hypothetical protein